MIDQAHRCPAGKKILSAEFRAEKNMSKKDYHYIRLSLSDIY